MYIMPINLTLPSHIWLTQMQALGAKHKGPLVFQNSWCCPLQMVLFKNMFNIILIDLVMFNTIIERLQGKQSDIKCRQHAREGQCFCFLTHHVSSTPTGFSLRMAPPGVRTGMSSGLCASSCSWILPQLVQNSLDLSCLGNPLQLLEHSHLAFVSSSGKFPDQESLSFNIHVLAEFDYY